LSFYKAPLPLTTQFALGVWGKAMKLSKDKTSLFSNDFLTPNGIPPEVSDYRLGNRSVLGWVIDQNRVTRYEPARRLRRMLARVQLRIFRTGDQGKALTDCRPTPRSISCLSSSRCC